MRLRRSMMTMMSATTRKPVLRGVVFDLDGTLIKPTLDLREMYRRVGVKAGEDILDVMAKMDAEERARADGIIDELEEAGRSSMALSPGAVELCRWLADHGIRTAMVTRNTARTIDFFHAERWPLRAFEPAWGRDARDVPPKPDRGALDLIAATWGCDNPSELLMVGDSVENDVGFGKNAGAYTALFAPFSPVVPGVADFCVDHLAALARELWAHFEIPGPLGTEVPLLKIDPPEPARAASRATTRDDLLAALADGRDIDERDASGNTPLIYAADAGRLDVVRELLARGADPGLRGYLGATAVCRAARRGDVAVLEALLDAPTASVAVLDVPNDKLQYPLHFAAFKLHVAAVDLLLRRGANTFALDRKGRTPAEDTSSEAIRQAILHSRTQGGDRIGE